MRMSFGILQVTLPFTYSRGKTIYYQRAVSTDLRDRYTGKLIKHDLKTADWSRAAPMVAKLNKRYASEWEGLRPSAGNTSSRSVRPGVGLNMRLTRASAPSFSMRH